MLFESNCVETREISSPSIFGETKATPFSALPEYHRRSFSLGRQARAPARIFADRIDLPHTGLLAESRSEEEAVLAGAHAAES